MADGFAKIIRACRGMALAHETMPVIVAGQERNARIAMAAVMLAVCTANGAAIPICVRAKATARVIQTVRTEP